MLTMKADGWIFLSALCFIRVSSNEETYFKDCELNLDTCETLTLGAPLGSSVLLQCSLATSGLDWVSWAHAAQGDLVHLKSDGHIKFLDHRFGRVKAFPNQASQGNYSIRIDELTNADLGCYRCTGGHECLQVELVAKREETYIKDCELNLDVCETLTLGAPLGSSVLLQCSLATSGLDWVSWAHAARGDLVHLKSDGHITFLDHRFGRVKAFPNQASQGNYSIRIDELTNADLGCYRCMQGHECFQVELVAETGAQSGEMWLLIYVCVCVAAFILLSVGGYCCMKCEYVPSLALSVHSVCWNNRTQDNANNPEGAGTEGVSPPTQEMGRGPVDHQQRGVGNDVYENDDQDPSNEPDDSSRNYCDPLPGALPDPAEPTQSSSGIYPNLNQFDGMEGQRTKLRFHQELFSRLRQASLSRHYYVNRGEISKQEAMSTQLESYRRDGEFKNPIYNRSTDQLNHR